MDELKTFFEGIAVPAVMSMFGGIAKIASRGFKSWRQLIASLFVSGFAGVVVHLFIQDTNISPSTSAALVGLSGYSGVLILDGLVALSLRALEKTTGQRFEKAQGWDGIDRRKGESEK